MTPVPGDCPQTPVFVIATRKNSCHRLFSSWFKIQNVCSDVTFPWKHVCQGQLGPMCRASHLRETQSEQLFARTVSLEAPVRVAEQAGDGRPKNLTQTGRVWGALRSSVTRETASGLKCACRPLGQRGHAWPPHRSWWWCVRGSKATGLQARLPHTLFRVDMQIRSQAPLGDLLCWLG